MSKRRSTSKRANAKGGSVSIRGKAAHEKIWQLVYGPQRLTGTPKYDEIWKHVYHPLRLQIIHKEWTVQGKVARMKKEPDGDWHMWLDSGQECQIICACKITQVDAIGPCQGYMNSVKIPKPGDKVTVTGSYVYDIVHKQYEIHPVFSIK